MRAAITRELGADLLERGAGARRPRSVSQLACGRCRIADRCRIQQRLRRERREIRRCLEVDAAHAFGRDADDREALPVQHDLAADDARDRRRTPSSKDRARARRSGTAPLGSQSFGPNPGPSAERLPKHVEVVARDESAGDLLRRFAAERDGRRTSSRRRGPAAFRCRRDRLRTPPSRTCRASRRRDARRLRGSDGC